MLFVVRFTDRPEQLAIRNKFLPEHIEWLDKHRATVLVAGSVRPDMENPPVGALWVVEAEQKADVEQLFRTDPFWVNGLRNTYEILHWTKAFPERRVQV